MKHTVSETKLNNGSRGLFIHIPDASVMTFELSFRAGEYLVKKPKWETPHLMEHILLGANEKFPKARVFQAEFEKNGAYCNASTGTYDITYEAECADFEWDRILELLLVSITKPLFLREEFTAEAGNIKDELTLRSNDHFRHLSLAMRERFGFPVITDQERVKLMKNVSLRDVRQHYKRTHSTSNMRFVVAGNLTSARKKILHNVLSNISLPPGEGRERLPNETPKILDSPLLLSNKSIKNLYFYIDTFRKKRLSDADADSLNLLNTMLTETLYSRILGTAREKGLLYHMSSGFSQTKNCANWWFGAQALPKNITELFNIIIYELKRAQSGTLKESDINAAKQYALGRYQRSGQTVWGTANGYSGRYFFDGVIDDYYKVPERIQAITKERIYAVSRAMFEQNVWGLGVLGNASKPFVQELHNQLSVLWPSNKP